MFPTAEPDIRWTVQKGDGSAWAWDFFWNTRAEATVAEDICGRQGRHLVTVNSGEASQLLYEKVTSDNTGRPPFPFVHALTVMWIGLYSNNTNNERNGSW
jgi:hypothetical protein